MSDISPLLWKKIPVNIFNECIYPYTYSYQPTLLLEDIRNYHETVDTCHHYYTKLIIQRGEEEPQNKNWWINDIGRFLNNDTPMMWGIYPFFFSIWNRSYYFQHIFNKKGVERTSHIMRIYDHENVYTVIRLYWGLFSKKERKNFMDTYCHFSYQNENEEDGTTDEETISNT